MQVCVCTYVQYPAYPGSSSARRGHATARCAQCRGVCVCMCVYAISHLSRVIFCKKRPRHSQMCTMQVCMRATVWYPAEHFCTCSIYISTCNMCAEINLVMFSYWQLWFIYWNCCIINFCMVWWSYGLKPFYFVCCMHLYIFCIFL